jgi:hypothetical protein
MAYTTIFKNDTITLVKHVDLEDYWLWDEVRGMNLAMGVKTEQEAFIKALMYYQKRLLLVEKEFELLSNKVNTFVESFGEGN